MGFLDLSLHLLSFVAPAFVLAILVAWGGRLLLPRNSQPQRWWLPVAANFLAGCAALAGGLLLFGRDGKMLTYAALVVAVGTAQWLVGRGWRS